MPDNRSRKRPIQVKFFVDERELSLIKARMAQLRIENMSAYLRKIVQFNEEIIKGQIKELVRGSVEEALNELHACSKKSEFY